MFEVCDCLKLMSIHLDLCVDATGVVCHQLGFLGTDLHAVGCGGFVEGTQLILPVLPHQIMLLDKIYWVLCTECKVCIDIV